MTFRVNRHAPTPLRALGQSQQELLYLIQSSDRSECRLLAETKHRTSTLHRGENHDTGLPHKRVPE